MVTRAKAKVEVPVKDPAPVDAPPDQPIPAQPAPRPQDAPHTQRARRGNRPSYVAAARPDHAQPLYERVCDRLGAARGVFGADMAVELVNDGPVTVMLEV